ncbi:MAG: class I SAM-dependent methyltransferase [Parvularcula sp.]|jgi:ubiquinone/menaquinone biosynthesis C-methylase UbiE|nr:class I SAM-dependent methyltransferase [Parvularcula sp.]
MTDDTFDRSCAHWSEEGRAEMERFYAIASVDYRHLAEARGWGGWLKAMQEAVGRPLNLLDVACGSGKFPAALNRYARLGDAGLGPIDYALLDPSRFSIEEARATLEPPFVPGASYETTLQALDCPPNAFDVVWATHALYAVPPAEIGVALERFIAVCAGEGFIAHAYADAHYLAFQRRFLEAFGRKHETLYTSAEDVIASLRALGVPFDVQDLTYENGAGIGDRGAVEGYLQRCVFDESVSLEEMERADGLADYLASCRAAGDWRFSQSVALISIFP